MPLRILTEEDLPLVRSWRNAPEVRKSMYSTHEIGEAEHRAWFARMQLDAQSRWFLHEDESGCPSGVVYFTQYRPENGSSFWGFYTGAEASPGTGTRLGIEALDKAFLELKLHKLNAEVLSTNERSLLFHKKLGFQQEGSFRDFHFNGERYIDVIRFGMLETEWPQARADIQERIKRFEGASSGLCRK